MKHILAIAALLALAAPAVGAQIARYDNNVFIIGPIASQDYAAFLRTATPETTTIYLNSPGGILSEAIVIGRLVRERKYETIVPENAICSSGCALIWFAGVKRRLDGRLGLHSAREQSGITSEPGNALMAAFLREMGMSELMARLPSRVVPGDMWWFDAIGLAELGVILEPQQAAKKPVHQFSPDAAQAEINRRDLEAMSRWTFEEWEKWDAFWKSLGRALEKAGD
jgi:hypothetical protein